MHACTWSFLSPNSYFSTWFLTPRWCWEGNTSTACPQRNTSLPPSTCTWTSSISSSLSCPLLAMLGIRSRVKGYAVQRGQGFLLRDLNHVYEWLFDGKALVMVFLRIFFWSFLFNFVLFSNKVYCNDDHYLIAMTAMR